MRTMQEQKMRKKRRGRVSDDTFEFLLYYIGEYWDILQKQEYLFINIKGDTIGKPLRVDSVYDMFERMEKKTGIKITPHMLRRYYANTRWEADWPLEMISQALGHKHLDTTIRYLNVLDDKLKTASQEFYRRLFQTLRSRTVFGKQEVKMNAGKYICLAAGRTGR